MNLANSKFDTDPNNLLLNTFAEAHFDVRDYLGNRVYTLKDGDIGAVGEIEVVYPEPLESEDLLESIIPFQKALRNLVPGIPAYLNSGNTTIQIICSSRKIENPPEKIVEGSPYHFPDDITGRFLKSEEEYLFKTLNFVKRKFYLAVRFTPRIDDRKLMQKITDYFRTKKFLDIFRANQILDQTTTEYIEIVEKFCEELDRLDGALGGKISWLEPEQLCTYVQNILSAGRDYPVYPSAENIHTAINTPAINANSQGISNSDGGRSEVYYLSQLPGDYSYGIFSHFLSAIPHTNFDLIWTFAYGSGVVRTDLKSREAYLESKSSRQKDAEQFKTFREQVSTFNPYGTQSVRLIVHNPPRGFDNHLQSVASDFVGTHMPRETQIPVHMLATSLPLNANRRTNSLKGRSRVVRLDAALGFVPLYTGPPADAGSIWRPSFCGTPARFDLFAGEGNKITTAIGTSRAGKSVLIALLILEFLARYSKAVVRGSDIRTSYQKLTDLAGGRIIEFSEKRLREDPYSPFALENWDETDLENIKILILAVVAAKNPDAIITAAHSDLLKQAISLAYNSYAGLLQSKYKGSLKGDVSPHPVWENIVAKFPNAKANLEATGTGSLDSVTADLTRWTMNLTPSGEYGFIFSAKQRVRDSENAERILIYDMQGTTDPVLKIIASMMANMKIMRDISRMPKNIRKLVILDELGQQLRGSDKPNQGVSGKAQEIMGEMIVNIAATAAKTNTQVIGLTNLVSDYTENPAGKALWNLSEQQLFLPMGKLFKAAKEAWGSDFNEAEWEIIKSLRRDKANFRSSLYVSSNNDTAPFRGGVFLPLSPFMDALTTTSGSQETLYKTLRSNESTTIQSLEYMAEKHPYGRGLKTDAVGSVEDHEPEGSTNPSA